MKLNAGNWAKACGLLAAYHSEKHMRTEAGTVYNVLVSFVTDLTGLDKHKVEESVDLVMSEKPYGSPTEKGRLIAASLQQKASMR